MNRRIKRDDSGFTLVELLVVVLMLGVLSSMAILGVQGARRSSTVQACATDWQAINAALQAYGLDHRSPTSGMPEYAMLNPDPLASLVESDYLATSAVSDSTTYRANVEVLPDGASYAVWISDENGAAATTLTPDASREAVAAACSTAVGQ